jgi:hypothetical protein
MNIVKVSANVQCTFLETDQARTGPIGSEDIISDRQRLSPRKNSFSRALLLLRITCLCSAANIMRPDFGGLRYRYHILPSSTSALAIATRHRLALAAAVAFSVLYLLALIHFRLRSYRDPTSFFFDPDRGYAPIYSDVRQRQANDFIDVAASAPPFPLHGGEGEADASSESLCVGMATVARANARYFRTSVGSLLEGLDSEERRRIYLILMVAHTDPTVHPAHNESWLRNVADKILLYDLPEDQMNHLRSLEKEGSLYREKGLFDYTYLLKSCLATGAPYIIMLEDDVLALDGWYHRTEDALHIAETQSALMKASADCEWLTLYLVRNSY